MAITYAVQSTACSVHHLPEYHMGVVASEKSLEHRSCDLNGPEPLSVGKQAPGSFMRTQGDETHRIHDEALVANVFLYDHQAAWFQTGFAALQQGEQVICSNVDDLSDLADLSRVTEEQINEHSQKYGCGKRPHHLSSTAAPTASRSSRICSTPKNTQQTACSQICPYP